MKSFVYSEEKINKLPKGSVFTYMDFISKVTRSEDLSKMAVFDIMGP
jgi:hypothetical protein